MAEPAAESSEVGEAIAVVAAAGMVGAVEADGSVSVRSLVRGAGSDMGSLMRRLMRGLSTPEAALVAAGV